MIKILAIGNSFSQNATHWLQTFDKNLFVRNLYIGGCSLETHCGNVAEDKKAYAYEENGYRCRPDNVSVKDALDMQKWDYITVQQCSGFSGKEETYYPFLPELIGYVRRYSDAEIVFHQTWAYETGATHPQFALYGGDRRAMFESIVKVSESVAARENLKIIRTGEAVEKMRGTKTFDYDNGALAVTCDGYHLSPNYGCFLAAGVWLKFFTGKLPDYLNNDNLSEPYREIKRVLELAK